MFCCAIEGDCDTTGQTPDMRRRWGCKRGKHRAAPRENGSVCARCDEGLAESEFGQVCKEGECVHHPGTWSASRRVRRIAAPPPIIERVTLLIHQVLWHLEDYCERNPEPLHRGTALWLPGDFDPACVVPCNTAPVQEAMQLLCAKLRAADGRACEELVKEAMEWSRNHRGEVSFEHVFKFMKMKGRAELEVC